MRYYPYGETRYISGSTPTSYRFTGQREDATIGLYFYNARFYDAALGRFVQADSIVPDFTNPQDLNRYSYVRNSPLKYTDPSGHCIPGVNCPGTISGVEYPSNGSYLEGEARAAWLMNYILWQEQEQVETGGMLDSATAQSVAASELNGLFMKDPEVLEEVLFQEILQVAPQAIAMMAMAGRDVLLSGGERVMGRVRRAISSRASGSSSGGGIGGSGGANPPQGRPPGPTIDPRTGVEVNQFIVDPDGNVIIEPVGGHTTGSPDGRFTQSRYSNGSYYQRYDAGHPGLPSPADGPHGHGYQVGTGSRPNQAGASLDVSGNVVPSNSPAAHWPAY